MSDLNTQGQRLRKQPAPNPTSTTPNAPNKPSSEKEEHPLGPPQHGSLMQLLRILGFAIYFFASCLFIHFSQLLGAPLYLISKDWFYAYQALCKQHFGLLITTMTQWWSPTLVRISGDSSVAHQLHQSPHDGSLHASFPDRIVLIANHQLYTDWLYLWWFTYTNTPPTHGHIYIILKQSLKFVPVIGPAMMFYNFVFMARKWATDQARLRHRLSALNTRHSGPLAGPQGPKQLDPMWLLIFPEGTNLSGNTRRSSAKFASKAGIPDLRHQILPRSTGLQFCLQELRNTVPWVYDCTIAYEGIPDGAYGQDLFTLRSVYFQGRPPRSVNMHWRRFAVKDLPIDDHEAMSEWVLARWREKDELLETFRREGAFPGSEVAVEMEGGRALKNPWIDTEVMPGSPFEVLQIFAPVGAAAMVGRVGVQILDRVFGK